MYGTAAIYAILTWNMLRFCVVFHYWQMSILAKWVYWQFFWERGQHGCIHSHAVAVITQQLIKISGNADGLLRACICNPQRLFFGRPMRDSGLTWSDLWKNRLVTQEPELVVVKAVVVMLNAELMTVSVQIFAIISLSETYTASVCKWTLATT